MRKSIWVVVVFLCAATNAFGIVYVDNSGPLGGDGTSWPQAVNTIQQGIDLAYAAGGDDVWVAQGVYSELRMNPDGSVQLKEGVALYGGFLVGDLNFADRDPDANVTVINGAYARGGSPANYVVVGANDSVLDGFVVTGGEVGMVNKGGAVETHVSVANCIFTSNSGLGMFSAGNGLAVIVAVTRCSFENNGADGLYTNGTEAVANITVTDSTFSGNVGRGLVITDGSTASVTNSVLDANSSGGLWVDAFANAAVTNCSITSNAAFGMYCNQVSTTNQVKVTNSILWGDDTAEIQVMDIPPVVTYSDVQGGYGVPADHNINADPLWADAEIGDLRLSAGSPCIDVASAAAAPAADIRGVARPQGAGDDMGAYEFNPPSAAFTANVTSGMAPLTVQFTDQSDPGVSPIDTWAWTFGDSGTSADQNPSHTYAGAGVYTVSLTVSTAEGSSVVTKTNYITVQVLPAADFSATPTSGLKPLDVAFSDLSVAGSQPITGWAWNFGDSGTSTEQNPSHTYANAGVYTVSLRVTTAVGNDVEIKADYVVVDELPNADFSGTPTSGLQPLAVAFSDLSTAGSKPITGWAWSFGDGGTSTEQDPSHTYADAGVYTVSLTVTTAAGSDIETKADYVVVDALPNADFSGTPTSGLKPLAVAFSDLSTAGSKPITGWAWSFGDGGTSTEQNPSHTYADAGVYTVSLTVTTAAGSDIETKADYVVVDALPNADFSGTPTSGLKPLAVAFSDLSAAGSKPITGWAWSFGDGGTSADQNPSHTYADAGVYTVSLTVTTAAGSDIETKADYIVVDALPNADFSGTPTSGLKPLAVAFSDLSTSGSKPITGWAWSFGDGGTSTAQNPSHTYASAGVYAVSLTVTTSAGSDIETKAGYITVQTTAPTAAFVGMPTSGLKPLTVQFTDQSTAGTSPITSWAWTFGDGGTSTAQNPSHVYAAGGSYSVALTVTTADGTNTATKTNYIIVQVQTPTAAFVGTPTSGLKPLTVQFTDQSTAGTSPITSRAWTFGDGGTSTAQNPSHVYANAGTYTVTLTVTTADGSSTATRSNYITVQVKAPTAAFVGTPTSGLKPLTVQFTDQSTAGTSPITSWAWTFGDGGTSTAQNPSHIYANAGTYTVALTVTTADGSNTVTKTNYITVTAGGAPIANFSACPTSGWKTLLVFFKDLSSSSGTPITKWLWKFGDGATSTARYPMHLYTKKGVYTVSLTVTNANGSNTITKTNLIQVK